MRSHRFISKHVHSVRRWLGPEVFRLTWLTVAVVALALAAARCGYATQQEGVFDTATVSTATVGSTTIRDISVPEPDLSSKPEEIMRVSWGEGKGQLSMGEGDFGTSGPDYMAISPDGKSLAIVDRYAKVLRVNFYSDATFVGQVTLEGIPAAMVIDDNREVYALYHLPPAPSIAHLGSEGEVLETIPREADLDPADLVWAGPDLYVFYLVGGTEDAGFVPVVRSGARVAYATAAESRAAIRRSYPVDAGALTLGRDKAGAWMIDETRTDGTSGAARLVLPASVANAAAFPFGSARGGLPVLQLFSSFEDGRPSLGCYVAVDVENGMMKTATVQFEWRLPGGMAVVGPDAVYVMRPD